jgi:hypothetical protein
MRYPIRRSNSRLSFAFQELTRLGRCFRIEVPHEITSRNYDERRTPSRRRVRSSDYISTWSAFL